MFLAQIGIIICMHHYPQTRPIRRITSMQLVHLGLVLSRLIRSTGQLCSENINLMELMIESSWIEERSKIESIIVRTVRFHMNTWGKSRPSPSASIYPLFPTLDSHFMPVDGMGKEEMFDFFRNLTSISGPDWISKTDL